MHESFKLKFVLVMYWDALVDVVAQCHIQGQQFDPQSLQHAKQTFWRSAQDGCYATISEYKRDFKDK